MLTMKVNIYVKMKYNFDETSHIVYVQTVIHNWSQVEDEVQVRQT